MFKNILNIYTLSTSTAGYVHLWVNHDLHYVDPETGVHTNRIESRFVKNKILLIKVFHAFPRWFAVKRQLPRGGNYDLKR